MEKQEKNQWHPGFAAAMRMELRENRNDLEFEEEHPLSRKPLQIDLLIIKNDKNIAIRNRIGRIFKRYNIVEYKSPGDEMGIDVFYKVVAYACLYKSSSDKENGYEAEDITVTLVRHNYPRKLMGYLTRKGYTVEQNAPGIYILSGRTIFAMQVIVSGELESREHIWLNSLSMDISHTTYKSLLLSVDSLEGKEREEYGDAVLEVVSNANSANIERWKEEAEMCPTLERIMAPELEEGRRRARQEGLQEGLEEGREQGRQEGRIITYAELGLSVEDIAERVSLSVAEVKKIINQNQEN